jgi:two-component system sensor histidine kinase DctS
MTSNEHTPLTRMDPAPGKGHWLWLLPRLAFVLFVTSVAVQLWLSERSESEEERAVLISDMLWLEQSLRFNLQHNEDLLGNIDTRQRKDSVAFEAYARSLLGNHTGLRRLAYLDAGHVFRFGLPSGMTGETLPNTRLAHSLGKPVYGAPFRNQAGEWLFAVHVPLSGGGREAGTVVGIYAIQTMLEDTVPWWLAQRNHIGVDALSGQLLAKRSRVETQASATSHRISFDPPGHGLILWAAPIRSPIPLSGRLLSASLILLAVLVLWSLWALRRHMQHRLAAEQALREQHAFRKAMEDSLQTGLRARDLHGRITYVNPAFCRMVGWSTEELVGREPPMPYWMDEEIDIAQDWNARILAGQAPEQGFEIRFRRHDGEIFWALIHEAPLVDAQGRHTGWMGSIVDITQHKQSEELKRQQQERLQATARLVSMGEMASSLAHELNQPLAAISSYTTGSLNLIDSKQTDLTEIHGVLAKVQAQAQRAGHIIRRIYEFVRRAEPKWEACDMAELIDEIAALVEVDARRHQARIRREVAADLPILQGDKVLLGQALFNLMRNGIEAMRNCPKQDCALCVGARVEGEHIRIDIADLGPGIPDDIAECLFEPFFTTKSEGMGMGLNICRSIIEAHQGRISLAPNPKGGTIFTITLPIRPA